MISKGDLNLPYQSLGEKLLSSIRSEIDLISKSIHDDKMSKEFRISPTGTLQVRNIGTNKWSNRCTEEGCKKAAQGKSDKCSKRMVEVTDVLKKDVRTQHKVNQTSVSKHGGGNRCTEEGCKKAARR